MEEIGGHTAVLQRWLEQLQHDKEADFVEARNAVINHASDRMEKLTRRMLRNFPRLRRWEQTGDVLQNAVLRLHRSLATIRPESARQFYGLAAAQIRRELIDLTRHYFGPQGVAANHLSDDVEKVTDGKNKVDHTGEPSSLAAWTEFHEKVQRLPDAEREVFDLLWYEGLTQQEAAEILGVTDRTVKNRWRNAKLLLQEMLP